jgi:hypothetical protein
VLTVFEKESLNSRGKTVPTSILLNIVYLMFVLIISLLYIVYLYILRADSFDGGCLGFEPRVAVR